MVESASPEAISGGAVRTVPTSPRRTAQSPGGDLTAAETETLNRVTRREYHRDVREGGRSMRGIITGIVLGLASWATIAVVAILVLR